MRVIFCRRFAPLLFTLLFVLLAPTAGFCSGLHEMGANLGKELGVMWILPFVCMLLSIAVMPLAVPHFWQLPRSRSPSALPASPSQIPLPCWWRSDMAPIR